MRDDVDVGELCLPNVGSGCLNEDNCTGTTSGVMDGFLERLCARRVFIVSFRIQRCSFVVGLNARGCTLWVNLCILLQKRDPYLDKEQRSRLFSQN